MSLQKGHGNNALLFFVFHIIENFALHPIPIVSENITNKIVDELVHLASYKPFSRKIQNLLHVVMK
jgi:hypothetical protein